MAFGQREHDRIEALLKTAHAAAATERGRLSDLEVSRASAVTEMEWLGQSGAPQNAADVQRGGEPSVGAGDEAGQETKPALSGVFVGSADKRAVLTATIDTLSEEIASCREVLAACECEATKLTSLLRRFEKSDDAQTQEVQMQEAPASDIAVAGR